jgi:hypothetical protein
VKQEEEMERLMIAQGFYGKSHDSNKIPGSSPL